MKTTQIQAPKTRALPTLFGAALCLSLALLSSAAMAAGEAKSTAAGNLGSAVKPTTAPALKSDAAPSNNTGSQLVASAKAKGVVATYTFDNGLLRKGGLRTAGNKKPIIKTFNSKYLGALHLINLGGSGGALTSGQPPEYTAYYRLGALSRSGNDYPVMKLDDKNKFSCNLEAPINSVLAQKLGIPTKTVTILNNNLPDNNESTLSMLKTTFVNPQTGNFSDIANEVTPSGQYVFANNASGSIAVAPGTAIAGGMIDQVVGMGFLSNADGIVSKLDNRCIVVVE